MMESGLIGPLGPQKWIGIRMTDSPRNPGNPSGPSDVGAVPNVGRRRLLQAGISTAPVLMTVVSRPVLAGGICQSPSGFVSGNVSNIGMGPACTGLLPADWPSAPSWPGSYVKGDLSGNPGTLFADAALGLRPDFAGANSGKSMLYWLDPSHGGPGTPYNVARLCIASLLNVAGGRVPVLTKAIIQHLWNEYATNNYYHFHPGSITGAVWNEAEIIEYLNTTMSSPV